MRKRKTELQRVREAGKRYAKDACDYKEALIKIYKAGDGIPENMKDHKNIANLCRALAEKALYPICPTCRRPK